MRKLFLDLETLPDQTEGALNYIIDTIRPPANYKKQESKDRWMEENAESKALEEWKKSALKGIAGEVCSIAWAFDDKPVAALTRTQNITEADVLGGFFDAVRDETKSGEGAFPSIQWIGHNIRGFDLRFLFQRAVINNLDPGLQIPINDRHGSRHVFDTMEEWEGFRQYAKLDDIFYALQIDMGEEWDDVIEIDGSQVWDLWQSAQYGTIRRYNMYDVEKVREVYRRLTWGR